MSKLLEMGADIVWRFPGSGNLYAGVVTEVIPAAGSSVERYRVKGDHMDCYAFRSDLWEL